MTSHEPEIDAEAFTSADGHHWVSVSLWSAGLRVSLCLYPDQAEDLAEDLRAALGTIRRLEVAETIPEASDATAGSRDGLSGPRIDGADFVPIELTNSQIRELYNIADTPEAGDLYDPYEPINTDVPS